MVGNLSALNVPDVIFEALVVSVVALVANAGKSEICDLVIRIFVSTAPVTTPLSFTAICATLLALP